jgi:hypothetical protein
MVPESTDMNMKAAPAHDHMPNQSHTSKLEAAIVHASRLVKALQDCHED